MVSLSQQSSENHKNIEAIYPLSSMQKGMLFHSLYDPHSGIYFVQFNLCLEGQLKANYFQKAWQKVVDRHSILRTFFVWEKRKNLLQVVRKQVVLPWTNHDWRSLSPTEQQNHLETLLEKDRKEGFNLNKAPLMRCTLIQLSDQIHQFIWSYHHILKDGWCSSIIAEEVLQFYQGFLDQKPVSLDPPIPYQTYIDWLQKQDLHKAELFWRNNLQGITNPTSLNHNSLLKKQTKENNIFQEKALKLSTEITQKLQTFCRQYHLTLNTITQGVWALLLSRYCGDSDVIFGATVSGRPPELPGVESMVGLFINTLPVRVKIPKDKALVDWFKQLQNQHLEREAYGYTSLIDIQGWSEIPRNISLFESILVFENYPSNETLLEEKGSLKISQLKGFQTTNYPLTVTAMPEEEFLIEISYNTQYFTHETITQIITHLETLFKSIANNPFQVINELSLLTDSEKHQLLVEWNNTQVDYSQDQCLHQLFEAQVIRTPNAIAIEFEGNSLTYYELNQKANQLANYLHRLGVKADSLVGICVERSLNMIVGLLGILKAGGAYIPIDPTYPKERINYMLEDSKATILVSQLSLKCQFVNYGQTIIYLEEISNKKPTIERTQTNVSANNLAYVIYTSGSTGKPKGVQICHQAIVNFLTSMADKPGIKAEDVLLSVTTLSFDIAGLEIFLPLICGAKVVLVSRETAIDGVALKETIEQCQPTIMQATPATWQMLVEAEWQGNKQLKILCGGEALSHALAKKLLERTATLWNMYGPTETTVWSLIHQVKSAEHIPIGRPINNTTIYILDSDLNPVPIGVPGELYIGGAGLAKGYLNRPDLTTKKFIDNPFNSELKLYKTGDLARYLKDGTVEFLGRIDYQVKIRGFRIELGEIEAVLNQHPSILNSVVIAKQETVGTQRLVAYYTSSINGGVAVEELRQFLGQNLPNYMIPSVFIVLEEFPLTPNGKINRLALPEPTQINEDKTLITPRTPIEQQLVTIWKEVLGVNVGINDDFFTLGGHSLLATQVISRIRQQFDLEIPLRSLFESPTILQLSSIIEEKINQAISSPKLQITQVSRDQLLPLSFAQQRLWFLDQLNPGNSDYNIATAVQLEGLLNIQAVEQSINEIVQRHEGLRTTFQLINNQPVQVIASQVTIPLVRIDLQSLSYPQQEKEIQRLAIEEAKLGFKLQEGPLLRIKLLQLEAEKFVILFTMHHIITDVWSMGVFIQEFSTLYQAFCQNQPSPLAELSIQYADFAYWQYQWLQGEILDKQLTYWKHQLSNLSPLNLSKIEQRSSLLPVQTSSKFAPGEPQSFNLSQALSHQLNTLSEETGVTLFMVLLAALQILLYRYTKQKDFVIGTDIANRNLAETEALIGFFVNILLLRTDLSGNPTFRELLVRVRETTLEAYAHQDLPFAKIVETLQPERTLDQTPLFQVLLVFQNTPISSLELPGITLTPLDLYEGEAKFDLVLFIEETDDGIEGTWKYKSNLFKATTITQLSTHFQTLLNSIVNNSNLTIEDLEMKTEAEKHQEFIQQSQREQSKLNKFRSLKSIKPKTVNLSQEVFIKTSFLYPDRTLPLVIKPNFKEMDGIEWAKNNQVLIQEKLQQYGAILFRGFNLNQVSEFEAFTQSICPNLFANYGDLPREGISHKVYGSTPYPADKAILFHNESSHLNSWPQKIWFFCVQPSEKGGETPIVDCRKVCQNLDPELRKLFKQKRLMYVRNYIKDFDVSWQDFFQTTDKAKVENYCQQNQIEWQWLSDNGLRTKKVCPAIIEHPITKELVFFNQIQLHHISFLDTDVRQSLLSTFGDEGLPRNVYYGDGSPIEEDVINKITAIYQETSVSFPWQKGDVLMLDNILIAHSRNPYQGKRKIVVAMGEIMSLNQISY
ncbi:amino acid adenylation domain protein [Rippkaea orientalis PCC 8801]|uniref:Amino acid adenylation domain protein n=1 Tax=Rippkaea orientalis (strain PCC 8801 / RF-1) TaxID=41431 RepID=B7JWG9_RIPO1|nr:non-ribosomal peptide synthetase [Rippkaea orientalis]ACK67014.1 amino acid adenylation domain protein [Rippkaea orientalis PCC 8801]